MKKSRIHLRARRKEIRAKYRVEIIMLRRQYRYEKQKLFEARDKELEEAEKEYTN